MEGGKNYFADFALWQHDDKKHEKFIKH